MVHASTMDKHLTRLPQSPRGSMVNQVGGGADRPRPQVPWNALGKKAAVVTVEDGTPQTGGAKGGFWPPWASSEHLLTSLHTILEVEFGGHLPTSPSF